MSFEAQIYFSDTSDPAQRAVQLVNALLDPRYSSSASAISQQLLEIQLSPQGWTVADALLASGDPNLQFYGALSFQVKLNRDGGSGQTLNEQDASLVLDRLVKAFCSCVHSSGPLRVLDKISSALATYFVQTPTPWTNAIGKTAACLVTSNNNIGSLPEGNYPDPEIFKQLPVRHLQALLRLCRLFAEDLGKFEGKTLKQHNLEQAFRTCVPAFRNLVLTALSPHRSLSADVVEEALSAYASWSIYAVQHWQHELDTLRALQGVTDMAMNLLVHNGGTSAMAAADNLAEILAHDSKFVTKPQLSHMWPLIKQCEQLPLNQDPAESLPLLKLTAAWGKAMTLDMTKQPDLPMFREATTRLIKTLFGIDWVEEGCERIATLTDFWMHFVENFVDYGVDMEEGIKTQLAANIKSAIEAYFNALTRRDDITLSEVDEDYVSAWKRCCEDFAELLARLLESGDTPVYNLCADQLDRAVSRHSWSRMETVFYLLNSMANDYDGLPASEHGLARIFTSSLFDQITQPGALDQIPGQLKRLLVRFIDNYSSYFQRSPSQIPPIVTLLMNILKQNTSQKTKLADLSAKCLASICSSCRKVLVAMSGELLSFCDSALTADNLTPYQREKIYSGMAFVIQAVPDERDKLEPTKLLILKLHQELTVSKQLLTQGQQEQGEQVAVTAYESLAAVGKALHSGLSTVIVEEDDEAPAINGQQHTSPWKSEQGQAIQMQVIECLRFIELLPSNGDAWEGVCTVLRVGLSEVEPGPFVFPSSLVSGFLASMTPSTPRLEALVTTACAFLSAQSRSITPSVPTEIAPILSAVSRILISLSTPQTDPALAQLCTDFLERTLTRYSTVLVAEPNLEAVLHFQLAALTSDAPMLKRASAAFFAAALSQLPQLATVLTDPLAAAVAHQVAGAAQRSELDAVARVLRSLLLSGPGGKQALERALAGVQAGSDAEKRVFVQKVVMLRGGRGTAEAVKEFWAKARGTVGSF